MKSTIVSRSLPMLMMLGCQVAFAECVDECAAPRVTVPLFPLAAALTLETVPGDFVLDGKLAEWTAWGIADANASPTGTAHRGIAVAQSADGIVVALSSTRETGELFEFDLASLSELDLPVIGWQKRFGLAITYPDAKACARNHPAEGADYSVADCERWYAGQVAYREQLQGGFIRHLTIDANDSVRERAIADSGPFPLSPNALAMARHGEAGIEVLVPWDAWPAADALRLDKLYLRVSRCASGARSGPAPACRDVLPIAAPGPEKPGGPTADSKTAAPAMLPLHLASARVYQVTPCGLPLQGDVRSGFGWYERGYFLPGNSLQVSDILALHQPASAYQDAPAGLSPTPHLSRFGAQELGDREWLCYPPLTWSRGDDRSSDPSGWLDGGEDSDSPDYRTVPIDDGNLLIISGPLTHYSRTGMGQCGACPLEALGIWYLDRQAATLSSALRIDDIVDGFEDGANISIQLANDTRLVRYRYERCTYERNEDVKDYSQPGAYSRQCNRLEIDWCLREAAREFMECRRETVHLPPDALPGTGNEGATPET
jgi:hypothetical protein